MFCASQAFGAVVTCGVHESPISCQQRAHTAALNEKDFEEGVRAKAQFNQDIAVARAKFWATYPDKPGFEAARDKFVEMLRTKDMYFLILRSMAAIGNSASGLRVNTADYSKLGDLYVGGTPLDNGISRPSEPEFTDWADAFAKNLQANGGVFTLQAPANAFKALDQSGKEYERYILARDWAEFDLVNRIPVGYETPRQLCRDALFPFRPCSAANRIRHRRQHGENAGRRCCRKRRQPGEGRAERARRHAEGDGGRAGEDRPGGNQIAGRYHPDAVPGDRILRRPAQGI